MNTDYAIEQYILDKFLQSINEEAKRLKLHIKSTIDSQGKIIISVGESVEREVRYYFFGL